MAVQWECARLAAALWTYSTLHPILLCQGRAFLAPQWPVCTHSFSLSFCRTHTHTHFFFSLSLYTATSDQPFPSFPTRHIHFLIPSLRPSHPSLFHPSLYCNELCVSPLQLPLSPQLLSHLGFICMDADGVSRASRALLCPSRPRLRFVMPDNTRQCRDNKPQPARTKRALFLSFPLLPAAYCSSRFGDALFFLEEWICRGGRGGG